jgi:hypothetical protein
VGSSEPLNLREATESFRTLMQADLENLFKSKITYGWLLIGIFLSILRVLGTFIFSTTSAIVTQGLSDFIYIWSMLIIGITASAVASESGEFADSIMSKSVKRYDYILAKFSSRICYVMIVYSIITMVLVGAALRMPRNDYEMYGLIASILSIALVLIALTSIGVALSTIMPTTVISIIVLLILWYSMTFFFPIVEELKFLSPANLINQLPNLIQGKWNGEEWRPILGFACISITSVILSTLYFSKKDL